VGIKRTYYIGHHAMSCLETFEGGIATEMSREKTRNQHGIVQCLTVSTRNRGRGEDITISSKQ